MYTESRRCCGLQLENELTQSRMKLWLPIEETAVVGVRLGSSAIVALRCMTRDSYLLCYLCRKELKKIVGYPQLMYYSSKRLFSNASNIKT
jgi:hypothetical protein